MNILVKLFYFSFSILFLLCPLFILDYFEVVYIKSENLKHFIYFGVFVFSIFSFIFALLIKVKFLKRILLLFIPLFFLFIVLSNGILSFLIMASTWKTQTIIYQNKSDKNSKVEFQMLDLGFAGYNKRTVEIKYYTRFFYTTKPIKAKYENFNWKKVNLDVNELELKY